MDSSCDTLRVKTRPHVYLLGLSRSGSTIVGRILAKSSSDLEFVGELGRVGELEPTETCACGLLIEKCDRWSTVQQNLANSPSVRARDLSWVRRTTLILPVVGPLSRNRLGGRAEVLQKVTGQRKLDTRGIVDSTKVLEPLVLLGHAGAWPTLTVWVVRNPIAVVASKLRRGLSRGWLQGYLAVAIGLLRCAAAYRQVPLARRAVLHYEDVMSDPTVVLLALEKVQIPCGASVSSTDGLFGEHELGGTDFKAVGGEFRPDVRWVEEAGPFRTGLLHLANRFLAKAITAISGSKGFQFKP